MEQNPEKLLNDIATIIENRPETVEKMYHICWFEGKLQCLPANHTFERHTVFMTLGQVELETGLSNHNWDNLLHRVTMFRGEKI